MFLINIINIDRIYILFILIIFFTLYKKEFIQKLANSTFYYKHTASQFLIDINNIYFTIPIDTISTIEVTMQNNTEKCFLSFRSSTIIFVANNSIVIAKLICIGL